MGEVNELPLHLQPAKVDRTWREEDKSVYYHVKCGTKGHWVIGRKFR